jgi:serine/threonine protein kinase
LLTASPQSESVNNPVIPFDIFWSLILHQPILYMEVEEQGEQWEEVDGELQFRHGIIVFRKGDDYFRAHHPGRMLPVAQINPDVLDVLRIPSAHIYPPYSHDLTPASDPLPVDSYIKRPRAIEYNEDQPNEIPDLFLAEARICEILAKHVHPNIAQYRGCIVRDNRLVGLCLMKYDMTLAEKHKDHDRPLPPAILKGIESGIQHLHGLGIVHNDINPSNIMFKANDDTPVIIDFDSCGQEGDKLLKAGTMGWSDEGFDLATIRNDSYGLKKIEEAMFQ